MIFRANIEDRVEWHSFFQLHMANIHRKEGALNSILECLENGLTYNMNNLKYQVFIFKNLK